MSCRNLVRSCVVLLDLDDLSFNSILYIYTMYIHTSCVMVISLYASDSPVYGSRCSVCIFLAPCAVILLLMVADVLSPIRISVICLKYKSRASCCHFVKALDNEH